MGEGGKERKGKGGEGKRKGGEGGEGRGKGGKGEGREKEREGREREREGGEVTLQLLKTDRRHCPGYAPVTIAVNVTWIEREFNACLLNALQHVPTYLQPFSCNSSRKIRSSQF